MLSVEGSHWFGLLLLEGTLLLLRVAVCGRGCCCLREVLLLVVLPSSVVMLLLMDNTDQ